MRGVGPPPPPPPSAGLPVPTTVEVWGREQARDGGDCRRHHYPRHHRRHPPRRPAAPSSLSVLVQSDTPVSCEGNLRRYDNIRPMPRPRPPLRRRRPRRRHRRRCHPLPPSWRPLGCHRCLRRLQRMTITPTTTGKIEQKTHQ